jgi:hypothetical protein
LLLAMLFELSVVGVVRSRGTHAQIQNTRDHDREYHEDAKAYNLRPGAVPGRAFLFVKHSYFLDARTAEMFPRS